MPGIHPPPQPTLRTARLVLTPFRPDDAAAVYAYGADPEVARHVTWAPHRSVADAEAFLASAVGRPDAHVWAVRPEAGGDPRAWPARGAVEFGLDAPGVGAVHYVLARPVWGRGVATEAVRAVLDWAFGALPSLAVVRTTVAEGNPASARVLEKLGFLRVGTERARWPKRAEPVTLLRYERRRPGASAGACDA